MGFATTLVTLIALVGALVSRIAEPSSGWIGSGLICVLWALVPAYWLQMRRRLHAGGHIGVSELDNLARFAFAAGIAVAIL